jgi:hypothetical protein
MVIKKEPILCIGILSFQNDYLLMLILFFLNRNNEKENGAFSHKSLLGVRFSQDQALVPSSLLVDLRYYQPIYLKISLPTPFASVDRHRNFLQNIGNKVYHHTVTALEIIHILKP